MEPVPVPQTLDWVDKRAKCSIDHLYLLLSEVVDSDVKAMQAYLESGVELTLTRVAKTRLVVVKQQNERGFIFPVGSVVFEKKPDAVEVRSSRAKEEMTVLFTAKPTVDSWGVCRFQVGDNPQELWQVSRKALEDLFFLWT